MPDLIAALDAGTTSTRCVLFDASGRPVASAQKEHRQITPRPGWLEHDPAELLENARQVIADAMTWANATAEGVVALGITNQRETTMLWNPDTGVPVANAIVWSDARTADLCDELKADGGIDRFRDETGLPVATYFSGTKLKWLLHHHKPAGDLCFGTVDAWLLYNLTGRHATDLTNASRTLMWSMDSLDWDDRLLATFDATRGMMPDRQPSVGGDFGEVTDGPLKNVPVTAVLGDQQAALFGQCCFEAGEAKDTYGTGCFLLMHTGNNRVASTHGLLTTPACQVKGESPTWALEGSVAVAGSAVQWLRDNLGLIGSSAEVEPLANSVEDSGGVFFVPAMGGLFAPHWDSTARGTVVGITQQMTAAHLARATLDATCYQSADVFDAMMKDSNRSLATLNVDGGMTVNDRLLQFQADLLGVPVCRPKNVESTAAGAAYAAGLAVGFYESKQALRDAREVDQIFEPTLGEGDRRHLRARWADAVARARGWAMA